MLRHSGIHRRGVPCLETAQGGALPDCPIAAPKPPTSPASESPGPGEKILGRGLEFAQKLLPLLMESHPSGDPLQGGKRTTQNRTPNPSFTFFREYRTQEMKRQTRFCRLFTVCLFATSVNAVTNRKLTSYNAFLHRKFMEFIYSRIIPDNHPHFHKVVRPNVQFPGRFSFSAPRYRGTGRKSMANRLS